MNTLKLYSEPFAKTGNMAAEGFKRLLGRPSLGLLQTLLREGIQNVLDAAQGGSGPTVLIRLRTLTEEQRRFLCERVLAERPLGDSTRIDIDVALRKPTLRVLELCDFGTEGLSGPTRADAPHDGEERLNFVNFLRNVGASRDTHHGGGTYGYGKSSFYAMSSCSTIVVDSQTTSLNRSERRLMACHLGAAFDAIAGDGVRRRFTGRHWWGLADSPDSIDPVVNSDALAFSAGLGMVQRTEEQTGTSILVIDPFIGEEDLRSVADDIVEAVLWNFWPRMTETTPDGRKLKVHIEVDGEQIPVPRPEEFPPLDLFAAAMASHRARSSELKPICCGRPKRQLGNLVLQKGLCAPRRGAATREGSLIPSQASHIALMRPVELVVKYIEGEPYPDRRFEWAGVFICSDADEIEEAFALAEPPAHDDWIPDNLPKGNAKTFVRVALRELKEFAGLNAGPATPAAISSERGPSLAATAARMGEFLDGVSATGPGKPPRKSTTTSARKLLAISPARFVGLQLDDHGRPVAKFLAELRNDALNPDLFVTAESYLVVDGGSAGTDDLPGGLAPVVSEMLFDGRREPGACIRVGTTGGEIGATIPVVPNAAVGLKFRLRSETPA